MSLENVYVTPDVMSSCYMHAMSTDKEEIIGLLLGEIVPMDDSFFDELGSLEGGAATTNGSSRLPPVSTHGVSIVTLEKGSRKYFGNSTLGEGYGGTTGASSGAAYTRTKYSGPTVARVWAMRAIPRIGDRRKDRVEVSAEIYRATLEAERCSEEFGRHTRVVGWYHSHPHITPYPSHVDLATQASYQAMENGWVGLIFSVFPNANTPSTAPRVPIALERQLSSSSPATTSQPMTPPVNSQRATPQQTASLSEPPAPGVSLMDSAQPSIKHTDPQVEEEEGPGEGDALDATSMGEGAAVDESRRQSCGSFVMADCGDAIEEEGSSFVRVDREESSMSNDEAATTLPPSCDKHHQQSSPPNTNADQFFGDGELDDAVTVEACLLPTSTTMTSPSPNGSSSYNNGRSVGGIKRLGTGGSSQFGAPVISLHCFQSSPPPGGSGPYGHRKVPLITTPLTQMPLTPNYRSGYNNNAPHHVEGRSFAASVPLAPQFGNESLRLIGTLCEETDASRLLIADLKDGDSSAAKMKLLINAAVDMQALQRDALITNCANASLVDLEIPQLEQALQELKDLAAEVRKRVTTQ